MAGSGRDCSGIAGPYAQVQAVLREVFPDRALPALNGRDLLFSCDLSTPAAFDRYAGDPACRHPAEAELTEAVELRRAFMREHLDPRMRPEHDEDAREFVHRQHRAGHLWVIARESRLVATSAVGAGVAEMVQIGGVYTRREHRGRGYARAVVASSLVELRARGVRKAVLFTGEEMTAARHAYRALGFEPIGEYGLVVF
jgi:predicted GNAT family acetyltransferase